MSIESFLLPHHAVQLTENRRGIIRTAQELGLSPDTDIVVGTGGLALHHIDAHYRSDTTPIPYTPFDFDGVVTPSTASRIIVADPRARIRNNSLQLEAAPGRPPVTLLAGKLPNQLAAGLGAPTSEALARDRVTIDGVSTLSPDRLAHTKLNARRIQDVGGILLAHYTLFNNHPAHPVTNDDRWLAEVERAASMASRGDYTRGRLFNKIEVAPWLSESIRSNFAHPAFDSIRPNTRRKAA